MSCFRRLLRSNDGKIRVYIIAFMCSIFGILLSNIFSPNGRWTVVAANLWAILGLGFGAIEVARDETDSQTKTATTPSTLQLPTPMKANLLLVLIVLLLPVVYLSARFSIRRFLGAKYNNNGLNLSKTGEAYDEEITKVDQYLRVNPQRSEELRPGLQKLKNLKLLIKLI